MMSLPGDRNQENMRRHYDQMKRPSLRPFMLAMIFCIVVAASFYWGIWELSWWFYE